MNNAPIRSNFPRVSVVGTMARRRLQRIFGFASVIFGLCLAQAAFAGDPAPISALPGPAANWTGVYLGGDIGGVFNDAHYFRPTTPGFADTSIGTIDSRPTYGFYTGANYQILPWAVVGLEYAYTKLSAASYRELGAELDFLQKSQHVDSFTGRLGFLLSPETMVYGKAGYAELEVQGVQGFGASFQQTLPGVQAAVGIETRVTPNFSLRGEVSYTYADRLLSVNDGADLYRPSFLMFQVGAAFNLEPPASWGLGAASAAAASNAPAPPATRSPFPAILPAAETGAPNAPNWTGIEFGGFLSGNGNRVTYNDTVGGELGPYTDFSLGGGWFAGVNYQFQQIVVGVEGSGNYEAANFNNAAGGVAGTVYKFASIDRQLALTGRVGWLATADTLLYVKAGPANIRFTPNEEYWNAIAPNTVGGQTFSGYQAGIGVESFITHNLSIRVEGLYTHTGQKVVLQGVVPDEFALQPSVASVLLGLAVHI